ncbi:MAG: hypothetical protein ACK41V_08985 [Acidovorax sp.]|uniref:hypothetical protein n=1 Tax=Acidovorax sp. TaxID=1872122 RepID=UPI003918A788
MALVACKECKKEVASSAKKCPHCGVASPGAGLKEALVGLVGLGVAVAVTMTMCSGGGEKAEAAAEKTAVSPSASITPKQAAAVAVTPPKPAQAEIAEWPPMGRADARRFAQRTLQVVDEAQDSLADVLRLSDRAGLYKLVLNPLQQESERWPLLMARHVDDQRQHFSSCQDAMLRLVSLAHTANKTQTAETLKYFRQDEGKFQRVKQRCIEELAVTDAQITAKIAAEEADLQKRFGGGRECLTVFTTDKNGQVVAKPKPAHCKS